MIVVSDATPLNVLARIGLVDSLATLYGKVIIPPAVRDELTRASTPAVVRDWIESSPAWLEVRTPKVQDEGGRAGKGERQAIALAQELKADRLLADDAKARRHAEQAGIKTIGTLGLLELFSARGFCKLDVVLAHLPEDFRLAPALIEAALERHRASDENIDRK